MSIVNKAFKNLNLRVEENIFDGRFLSWQSQACESFFMQTINSKRKNTLQKQSSSNYYF